VNKPGRPLSTCPHPKGSGCNCNTRVTIAIPRNRKCACGPGSGTNTSAASTTTTGDAIAQLPKKTGTSRVQKNSISIPPSRKQSFDVTVLDRMNPDAVNLIQSHASPVGINGNVSPADQTSSPRLVPVYQPNGTQPGGTPLINTSWIHPQTERHFTQTSNGTFGPSHGLVSNSSPNGSPMNSASGRSSLDVFHTQDHTPASSVGSFIDEFPTDGASCCAKRPTGLPPAQEQTREPRPTQSSVNLVGYGTSVPAQNPSMPAAFFPQAGFNTSMNYASTTQPQPLRQSTVYTYPYPYGSYQAPLQYYQWEQMVANPQGNIPPLTPYTRSQPSNTQLTEAQEGSCTTHQCNCGPGCQCVGCTVHPFNSATKELVRSMVDPVLGAHNYSDRSSSTPQVVNGAAFGIVPLQMANGSPSPGINYENTMQLGGPDPNQMSWDDYLIVEYGNFFGCKGDLGTCPCGDDCVCAGCTFHRPTQLISPTS